MIPVQKDIIPLNGLFAPYYAATFGYNTPGAKNIIFPEGAFALGSWILLQTMNKRQTAVGRDGEGTVI